jgi:hypothetical protein
MGDIVRNTYSGADPDCDPDSDNAFSTTSSSSQPKAAGFAGVILTPDLVIAEKGV